MCFILSDSNIMGALPQALEFVFEVQRKKNNEKIETRKISFLVYKMWFFFLFWTPPTLKSHNRSATQISTNHLCTLIATKQHKSHKARNFLGVWELAL
jgi:hypothetical protein